MTTATWAEIIRPSTLTEIAGALRVDKRRLGRLLDKHGIEPCETIERIKFYSGCEVSRILALLRSQRSA